MKLLVEESDFIFCDVQDILRYLRQHNPATALRFVQAFKSTFGGCPFSPQILCVLHQTPERDA
jgi:hypothetical protein